MNIPETTPESYLTGTSALNIPTEDGHFADWHFTETFLREGTRFRVAGQNYPSTTEMFGEYGIRECGEILRAYGVQLEQNKPVYVASYVRAVLDLVYNLTKEHKSPDFLRLDDFLEENDKTETLNWIETIKSKISDTIQLNLINQWEHQQ